MRTAKIDDMTKGWFVGDFSPSVVRTNAAEVGVKYYKAGDSEGWHYHKVATEVTMIVSGEVEMCERRFGAGDIIVIEPGDGTAFRAITDAVTAVVKLPSVMGDKFGRGQ